MRRVFVDTNIFIYLLEECGELSLKAIALLKGMKAGHDELVTSALSVGETLVKPIALGDPAWAARYEALFRAPGVVVVPFDRSCSKRFAWIRAHCRYQPPDAMQLACAANHGCNLFVTNDNRLSKKRIEGIDFIVSLEQAVSII